jgi:hypothetical protein
MDRLTYRYGENGEYAEFISKVRGDGWYRYRASCEGALRLAEYEDTSFTPEEIALLEKDLEQYKLALELACVPSTAGCAYCKAHDVCVSDDMDCTETIKEYLLSQVKEGVK